MVLNLKYKKVEYAVNSPKDEPTGTLMPLGSAILLTKEGIDQISRGSLGWLY
jgi:hypothetical protein